jgi:protein O-mannosyl-transferase
MSMARKRRTQPGRVDGAVPAKPGLPPLLPAGLALLAILLYANTLGHELVFDDVTLIVQDPLVSNLNWWGIVWESGYRPVRTLTYALNYLIVGEEPFLYHLTNVVLHAANGLLILALFWRLTGSRLIAGAGAFIFIVHPVQTAAVAYVSGRKDLLAAFFMLLALILYLRFREEEGRRHLRASLAVLCFLLAVLSKEVAIVFPGLLLLVDAFCEWRKSNSEDRGPSLPGALTRAIRAFPALYLTLVALAAAALYYAVFVLQASRMEGFWGGTVLTNLGTSFKLFFHYVKLLFVPHPLLADYLGEAFPISTGLSEPATLACLLFLVFFLVLSVLLFPRLPLVSVGMLWFAVTIAPVLQLLPFHELAADHFLYVPMIGASLAGGTLFARVSGRRASWVALLVVGCVFSSMTIVRNRDWKDRLTLWEATYRKAPGSYRANVNLGQTYFESGRTGDGIRLTRRSVELAPNRALPYSNLGAMYYTVAREDRAAGRVIKAEELLGQARENFHRALDLEGDNPFTYSNLGNTYKEIALIHDHRNQPERAREARAEAMKLYERAVAAPDRRLDVQRVWYNIGLLHVDSGDYEAALGYLRRYVAAFPQDPSGNYWLGYCHFQLGECEHAVPLLRLAAEVRPTANTWEMVGFCYERTGRIAEAAGAYRQAVARTPRAETYYNLGRLLMIQEEVAEAGAALERAARLDPSGRFGAESRRLLREMTEN